MQQANTNKGFTLIELMIVIAVISILAAIAYPTYQDSMAKSRRADAKSALLELSTWMERYYTAKGCYGIPNTTTALCTANNAPTLPFTVTPKSGTANYNLTVTVTGTSPNFGTGFTLTATPIKTDAKCGTYTLNNLNAKSTSTVDALSDATAKSKLLSECW